MWCDWAVFMVMGFPRVFSKKLKVLSGFFPWLAMGLLTIILVHISRPQLNEVWRVPMCVVNKQLWRAQQAFNAVLQVSSNGCTCMQVCACSGVTIVLIPSYEVLITLFNRSLPATISEYYDQIAIQAWRVCVLDWAPFSTGNLFFLFWKISRRLHKNPRSHFRVDIYLSLTEEKAPHYSRKRCHD